MLEVTEKLLHHFENCSLTAYQDIAGIWTIGYGDTYRQDGTPVREGDTCTQAEADARFHQDFSRIKGRVEQVVKVNLPEYQLDALTSLTYNIGTGNLERSDLLKMLNNNDLFGAADQFKWWRMSGGQIVPGLIRRRLSELRLFMGYSDPIVTHEQFNEMNWRAWYE